jgi:NADH-quinone oxidoreductase subunit J
LDLTVIIILLAGLAVSAIFCVVLQDLLKASIALAGLSAILSIIMFILKAPLAAVFELSVCAGLITVIFVSAVSMTRVKSKDEAAQMAKARRKRFALLPILLIALLCATLILLWPHINALIPYANAPIGRQTEQDIFWNRRQADLVGQIVIILAGVYGVLVFFKERD